MCGAYEKRSLCLYVWHLRKTTRHFYSSFLFSFFFFFFFFFCPAATGKPGWCLFVDIHRFYFCQHLTHVGLMPQTRRLCRLL